MMPIDNHWNYGQEYRNQMMASEYESEMPKWDELDWEKGDLIDFDAEERESYYVMTAELNGVKYEGTGIYSCGELIKVEGIEISK